MKLDHSVLSITIGETAKGKRRNLDEIVRLLITDAGLKIEMRRTTSGREVSYPGFDIRTASERALRSILSALRMLLDSDAAEGDVILDGAEHLWEGAPHSTVSTSYDRNRIARARCIARFGTQCQICGLDPTLTYGLTAAGIIHVHHLQPVAQSNGMRRVDPFRDLIPLCPNCHAVVHRKSPPYTPEEVRAMLRLKNPPKGPETIADEASGTLAHRFAGRVGRIASGGRERLSEASGDSLAEHLDAKRRAGRL